MLQLSLLTKRALFASLMLCLLTGQLAVTKHSIDHLFHDNSSYCDNLASLESSETDTSGPVPDASYFLPIKTDNLVDAQPYQTRRPAYSSRAPPVLTLV